uniref:Uncharacterized protein n=1 Tax=Bracon brevicornis TaxID=1563983 RepID=A0A6V7JYY4_9HYME
MLGISGGPVSDQYWNVTPGQCSMPRLGPKLVASRGPALRGYWYRKWSNGGTKTGMNFGPLLDPAINWFQYSGKPDITGIEFRIIKECDV